MVGYLERFGVWDMNKSGVRLEHKRGGDDDEVELVLRLHERGRLFLKAGTEVGGGEGGGVSTCSSAYGYITRRKGI
jgi:outer membrane protein insertion porin family